MIDLGIKVDFSQLSNARRELKGFAEDKKKYGAGGLEIPVEVGADTKQSRDSNLGGLAEKAAKSAGMFRREIELGKKAVSDTVRDFEKLIKITSSAKAGTFGPTGLGGIKIPAEVTKSESTPRDVNLDRVTEKAARSAGMFRRETELGKKAVSDTVRDFDKLIKITSSAKAGTFGPTINPTSSAESERMRRESAKDAQAAWASAGLKPKRKTAGEMYLEQHGNMGRTVLGRPDDIDGPGGGTGGRNNSGQFMRRALGWGLAAAGVGTIAGFIGSSRSAYRSAIDEEGSLHVRGLTGSRGRAGMAASMGLSPSEYYHLENQLSRTGINEKGMGRSAMLSTSFAKSTGTDVGEVAGLRSSLYAATGSNSKIPDSMLLAVSRATATGMDKSRVSELLSLIGRNTGATAHAMGGAGMSSAQAATAAAMALLGLKDKSATGVFAKSGEFYNTMQHGLQGAGSPAGDIQLFQAMGGYKGAMTWEKIHELNVTKQGGFLERPDMLKTVMTGLGGGSRNERAGKLESMFPAWKLNGKGSELLVDMLDKGYIDKLSKGKGSMTDQLKGMAGKGDTEAARMLAEIKANPALSRQSLAAQQDILKIEAGDTLSRVMEPFERGAVKFADALLNKDWQGAFKSLDGAGKVMLGAAGLYAAGGALGLAGSVLNLGGKGAGALGALTGPGGILAGIGLGGAAAYGIFKDGANPLPDEKLRALGKNGTTSKFSAGWVPYQDSFQRAAKKTGIDVDLLYSIGREESGFNPRALSRKGAGGIMQLMPNTAAGLGVKNNFNPDENIMAGSKYFKSLMTKYEGNQDKSLAAYNWGPGNLDKWTKTHEFNVDDLPKETREYVRKVGNGASAYDQENQQNNNGSSDTALQTIADILRTISGHTEQAAKNSGSPPITVRSLSVGAY